MIQVRHGREEGFRGALTISNDQTLLSATLDFVHFNHGTCAFQNLLNHLLIHFERVLRRFRQEGLVGDDTNIGLLLI